jgi:DNA transformation protein
MSDFVQYVLELLAPLKDVRARKMFGGYGIYRIDVMFGLVADDVLYLKVDQETIPGFEARGLGPFLYEKKGKIIAMSYYQIPEEAMDSSPDLCEWAHQAYGVALRAKQRKSRTDARQQPIGCTKKKHSRSSFPTKSH